MTRFTRHLSYANVAATLALVLALGAGTAFAASKINGSTIAKGSISGKALKKNTLTGKQIKEQKLKEVPRAKDARSLGGVPAAGYVKGAGNVQVGRTTGAADPDPDGTLRSFVTPVGRFDLSCGVANADVRYTNTTAGETDLWRTVVTEGPNDLDTDGGADVNYFEQAPGTDSGYATTAGFGPARVELSAGNASGTAVLTATAVRVGTTCTFHWTLATTP